MYEDGVPHKSIREDALRINPYKDSKALIPRASAIILNRTKRERQEVEGAIDYVHTLGPCCASERD